MLTVSGPQTSDDTCSNSGNGIDREAPTIITRVATLDDLLAFYGRPPDGTMRAYVAEMDGEVVGIMGVVREPLWGKCFTDIKPELQPHLKSITIMRVVKKALKLCDEYKGPVVALADNAESCRIMHRLGFTHLHGGWYAWLN